MDDEAEKRRAYMRGYKERLRADPERAEKYRAQAREYSRKKRDENPELRELERIRSREYQRAKRRVGKTPEQAQDARDYHRGYQKEHRKNPDVREAQRLACIKYKYGLPPEEYKVLLALHDGCCHACKEKLGFGTGQSAVDHCHRSGKVRGLLCGKCNRGLGQFDDSIVRMEAALQYLRDNG